MLSNGFLGLLFNLKTLNCYILGAGAINRNSNFLNLWSRRGFIIVTGDVPSLAGSVTLKYSFNLELRTT